MLVDNLLLFFSTFLSHTHTHAHMHTQGLKKESGKRDEIAKFLEHATLLRGIEHPNIQSVLCVSVEDNYVPLVVYPMVEYGNMHDVLLSAHP